MSAEGPDKRGLGYRDSMSYFAGEDVAIRDVAAGRILFAWPLKVVSDDGRGLIACQFPGALGMVTAGYPDDPDRLLRELASGDPTLVERAWQTTTTISLLVEDRWWSTKLMWEASTGNFMCYYVDFRRPIRRNGARVDTLDLGLDLVAWGNGTWTWKDEDHLPLVRSVGWLQPDEEGCLDEARQAVVGAVEEQRFPFDGSLVELRPDPGSSAPVLPTDWNHID